MKYYRLILSLNFAVLFFISACKKENNTITFEGKVTEFSGGGAVEGVSIIIEEKKLENGAIPINYSVLGTTTTDASGNYQFTFEKDRTIEVKISAELDDFYHEMVIRDIDDLSLVEVNIENFILRAKAIAKISIENNGVTDFGDEISLVVDNDASICQTCCDGIVLNGAVDTIIYCNVTGNEELDYSYLTSNEFGVNFSEQTVYCPPGDTTQIFITY